MSTLPAVCNDLTKASSQTISFCNCLIGTNTCTRGFDDYNARTEKYAVDFANYQTYLTNMSTWQRTYDSQKGSYASVRITTNCDAIGCPSVSCSHYAQSNSLGQQGCAPTLIGYFGCQYLCSYSESDLESLMSTWKASNPPPSTIAKPDPVGAPPICKIQCCSQFVGNISGANVNVGTVSQNCSQQITNILNTPTTTPAPTKTTYSPVITTYTPITTPTPASNSFIYIMILLLSAFFIFTLL